MISKEDAVKRINLNDFEYLINHVRCLDTQENITISEIHNNIDCVIEDIFLKYLSRSILFTLPEQSKLLLSALRKIIRLQLILKTQNINNSEISKMVDEIVSLIEITKSSYLTLL